MTDIIIVVIVALIVGLAAGYVYRQKKSGSKCIGCPHSKTCGAAKENHEDCCCGSDK